MTLYNYQEQAVTNTSRMLASGKRNVIFQLPTGGGKTVCFSHICKRYTDKTDKSVLILVHRKELLKQARKTLFNAHGIVAELIIAGTKKIEPAKVYIGMVESVYRRTNLLKNIGLVIIDEAHIASFNKLHEHFPTQYIIGFTATPLSASKKHPLKNYYDDIICACDIAELIKLGALSQNITYAPKDIVDRKELAIKNGEFDEKIMGEAFSRPKHINNTVKAYSKWSVGTKTIVFNCTIDHSEKVNAAFVDAGYNSRHLDSTMDSKLRDEILHWFSTTPDAILNNVGILTAGFDEPTIETVIMNKATLSLPHWLQCTGRGSRITPTKSAFTIVDMGGNVTEHFDWNEPHDWYNIFHNPPKKSDKQKAAPIKTCPQCEAIIAVSCKTCPHCGYIYPTKEDGPEEDIAEFVMITKNINVKEVIERNKERKQYFAFFQIARELAEAAKKSIKEMNDENFEIIYNQYTILGKQWCKEHNKKFNQWHQQTARESLIKEVSAKYKKWTPPGQAEYQKPALNLIPNIANIQSL